jgi:hypothetical protein
MHVAASTPSFHRREVCGFCNEFPGEVESDVQLRVTNKIEAPNFYSRIKQDGQDKQDKSRSGKKVLRFQLPDFRFQVSLQELCFYPVYPVYPC